MKQKHIISSFLLASSAYLAVLQPEEALGRDASEAGESTMTAASEDAKEPENRVPETLTHKDRASPVMDTPLDGTSIETFTAGLEHLDEEATEEEYRSVMSALDFLLFYDIGARRSKERLYARLNGKSPNEILEKVHKTRNQPRNNKD